MKNGRRDTKEMPRESGKEWKHERGKKVVGRKRRAGSLNTKNKEETEKGNDRDETRKEKRR